MCPPSRRRVVRASGTVLAVSLAGCFGTGTDGSGSSPSTTESATAAVDGRDGSTTGTERSAHDESSSSTNANETPGHTSETENEPTQVPESETSSPSQTTDTGRSPDCSDDDIILDNDTSRTVNVSARLLEGGRTATEEDGVGVSPTPTPTPTPRAVWSASPRLSGQELRAYGNVPDREGPHRLKVTVEDGPQETASVDGDDWEGTYFVEAVIKEGGIRFNRAHSDPPTGC